MGAGVHHLLGLLSLQVEDDSDAETYGEENEEQGNYSKRKIVSNWDRYQDTEKEVDNESGESQRGTDFSVLLSSADIFITPKGNSVPIKKILLLRSLCQALETTNLLSFSMDLLIPDISDEWNHAMCDLCVWRLSLSMMFARVIHTVICISISFLKKMFLAV